MKLCDYGCEREGKYQQKNGKRCCEIFPQRCPKVREKNSKGLKQSYKDGKRKSIKIIQPLINNERKCTITLRKNLSEKYKELNFEEKPFSERKRILLKKQKGKCAICGIKPFWNNKPLNFHYDHIDGNRLNNSEENNRLICPNCHSQTKTYCRGKKEIINEETLKNELLKTNLNISKSLKNLGVVPGGSNWSKAKEVIRKFNLARVDELA